MEENELMGKITQIKKDLTPDLKNLIIKDPKSPATLIPKINFGGTSIYNKNKNSIEYTFALPQFEGTDSEFESFYYRLQLIIESVFADKYIMMTGEETDDQESVHYYDKTAKYTYQSPTHISLYFNSGDKTNVLLVVAGKIPGKN